WDGTRVDLRGRGIAGHDLDPVQLLCAGQLAGGRGESGIALDETRRDTATGRMSREHFQQVEAFPGAEADGAQIEGRPRVAELAEEALDDEQSARERRARIAIVLVPGEPVGARHSQPFSSASRAASARVRAPSFCIADER